MNRKLRAMLWRITDRREFQRTASGAFLAACIGVPFVLWWCSRG